MWSINIFGFEWYYLFYNFFLYSFFGWIYESTLVSVRTKKIVNRGFLNGPIIPIYGAGATIVYMCLSSLQDNAVFVFVGGMVIATVLEYITSYVMEKLFHAKWWDYSNMKFNIKGRVCLLASFFWGFLSILMTEILQPLMSSLIAWIPRRTGEIGGIFIFFLFVIDFSITIVNTVQLDHTLSRMQKIREELNEYLEGIKWYAVKEEWKNKLEQISFSDWMEQAKEVFYEKRETLAAMSTENEQEEKKSFLEEMEEKLKGYAEKYQFSTKGKVKKRLLKAFPNLKSKDRESVLKELKEKMFEKHSHDTK